MANAIPDSIAVESLTGAGRPRERAVARVHSAAAIRWYVWCLVAASNCAAFGFYWDISWHMSIGRDTFWTAPHAVIYLAGILAGIACAYTILTTTFGSPNGARAASVRIWGLRGPLGCFLAAWGGGAMLVSAPFDNWWHNAYGLDVAILSPPHSLLGAGIAGIGFGAVLLVCSETNRATGENRQKLNRLLLYTLGLEAIGAATLILERTWPGYMHNSRFYFTVSTSFPLLLVLTTRVSRSRWAATIIASIYMAAFLFGEWILPLFPAEPKLGPVYQHITHFMPLGFPLLLIVPAFAIDLLHRFLGDRWGNWISIAPAGFVYLAAIVAAQWTFSYFLLSPAARDRVFGMAYFAFNDRATVLFDPYFFFNEATLGVFAYGMILALATAIVSSGAGMAIGNWMRQIKR